MCAYVCVCVCVCAPHQSSTKPMLKSSKHSTTIKTACCYFKKRIQLPETHTLYCIHADWPGGCGRTLFNVALISGCNDLQYVPSFHAVSSFALTKFFLVEVDRFPPLLGFSVNSADAILRAVLIVRLLFDLPHLKRSLVNLMDRGVSFSKSCWVEKNICRQ